MPSSSTAFSFSPPLFTEQDEQKELALLSPEQQEALWMDIRGELPSSSSPSDDDDDTEQSINKMILRMTLQQETMEIQQRGLEQLYEAIDQMAFQEKCEYLEALERCPHFIPLESPPIKFLQCESYNAWAAAARLVQYWKTRKLIFGTDRAFLPMTLLSDGAMYADLENFAKGRSFILSNPDRAHRPVSLMDRDAFAKIGRDSALRCSFYLGQVLSELPEAPFRGHVAIADCQNYDLYRHEDRVFTKRSALISESIPTRTVSIHIYSGYSQSVMSLVFPAIKFIFKHLHLRMFLHSGSSYDIQKVWAQYGLHSDHAHILFAGNMERNKQMNQFIQSRQEIEQVRLMDD